MRFKPTVRAMMAVLGVLPVWGDEPWRKHVVHEGLHTRTRRSLAIFREMADQTGKPVLVVATKKPAPGRPWVWHGEFFGHTPAPDIALLEQGFHIVYMQVPNLLGCPRAIAYWNSFYQELTEKYGFAKKAAIG